MFDLGWTELLVIGIVALIVVGPKDLPSMFKAVGNFVGKAKRMARDFSKAMNDAADDAGVGDVKRTLNAAANPMKTAMDEVSKSTESFTAQTMAGPAPNRAEMDDKRKEQVEKIRKRSEEIVEERLAKEAEEAEAATAADTTSGGAVAEAADNAAPKPAAKPKAASKKKTATKPKPKSKAPAAKKTTAAKKTAKTSGDKA